jgi:CubicO group peptidase (beta-lactamase class C family)
MSLYASALALLATLPLGAVAQEATPAAGHFPPSLQTEGASPESLAKLGALVQSLVDDEEVVGAELLVIKNGHSILHQAYGMRDLAAGTPMEIGSVFCVRSMTKPLIGTSILMLIEDGVIQRDDPIARYLPAFDVEGKRGITIEHLITHTSGLPFSMIAARDPRELESIRAVAELGAGSTLDFEPGNGFQYSDQGTDTLTAMIEVVSGMPAEDFVRERLLEPLGMQHSTCLMTEDHPLRARALAKYVGTRGEWTRFWSPEDEALFPIFLGSQGLYSTLEDYGRFMELWMHRGQLDGQRLLGEGSVNRALTPNPFPFPGATRLPGLSAGYGDLMQLWMTPDGEGHDSAGNPRKVVVFGHTGSDGTHAWVFPGQQAMVLYFTQSRNNTTGLRVEAALGELFLGVPFDPAPATPPLAQYLGYYREDESDQYRAIILDGDELALEVLGRAVATLEYVGEDSWELRQEPGTVLEFDRSSEGQITGYHIGDHREFRFEPSAELPSAEEIATRIAQAHRLDLVESFGPLRIDSELTIKNLGVQGELITWLDWPDRFRVDAMARGNTEHIAYDGERLRYESSDEPLSTLTGARAEALRLDNSFATFGDLLAWHPGLRVIQQLDDKGRKMLLLRTGDTSAPAATFYVEAETARVRRVDTFTHMPGLGRIGTQSTFGDFRRLSGMLLPFRSEVEVAHRFIGTVVTTVLDVEKAAELPRGGFDLQR